MGTEIEKKYRVSSAEAESLRVRLRAAGAEARGEEFEENTLYAGPGLEGGNRVLRPAQILTAALQLQHVHEPARRVHRGRGDEQKVGPSPLEPHCLELRGRALVPEFPSRKVRPASRASHSRDAVAV